jgi:hypothetical protein
MCASVAPQQPDSAEGASNAQVPNIQRCSTQTFFENRPVAYNVIYEFGGKQYSVQMPSDPGPALQLQITPGTVTYDAQSSYFAVEPPAYPAYCLPEYFLPFAIGLGFGCWGDHSGHGGHGVTDTGANLAQLQWVNH